MWFGTPGRGSARSSSARARSKYWTTAGGPTAADGASGHGLVGLRERADAGRARRCSRDGAGRRIPAGCQSWPVTIRLLIADDQALVRGALAALLDLEPDLEVVAQVGRGDEVARSRPYCETRRGAARRRDARAGWHRGGGRAARSTGRAGADGDDVRAAGVSAPRDGGGRCRIRRQGHARGPTRRCGTSGPSGPGSVDPSLATQRRVPGTSPLTARESDVLRAARAGGTVADVARELHLSEGTVRNHLSAAIGKTGARTRAEAARIALDNGWL